MNSKLLAAGGVLVLLAGCAVKDTKSEDSSKISEALLAKDKKLPSTLAATNLFHEGKIETPAFALTPYDVKVPLWSDGARKRRFIFVPPEAKITRDATTGKLVFPAGTTLVKHFTTLTDPEKPVETRVITLKSDGKWTYGTYAWNDDGTTTLNERPRKVTKDGVDYRLPSEAECHMCHTDGQPLLGFVPEQINVTQADGSAQIDALDVKGILGVSADELKAIAALPSPTDGTLPVEQRARVYMSVNCGPCHRPDGPDKANVFDMRLEATDTHLLSEGKIIPGYADGSILYQKNIAETERMPNLSLRPDPVSVSLFKTWLDEMPAE
jgi:hypothetical protein